MMKSNLAKHLSDLSIAVPDMELLETFHESTKYHPSTLNVDTPRIVEYLTSSRAILETSQNVKNYVYAEKISLPDPQDNHQSLNYCLQNRRTARAFSGKSISLQQLANVLHPAIAPTQQVALGQLEMLFRPYASGGGLYPVEVYPILLDYAPHQAAVTHYQPSKHALSIIQEIDRAAVLACLNDLDDRLAKASVVFIFTAVMPRTTVKYGARGHRFALLEAGQVCQNLSLTAVDNGLSTLPWGGFYDDQIADLLNIDNVEEIIVHCMALGAVTTVVGEAS